MNYTIASVPFPCSALSAQGRLNISCPGCDNSSYIMAYMTDSSSGDTEYYEGGWQGFTGYDLIVNVSSNSSLAFSAVYLPVNCSDLAQGSNMTVSCDSCNAGNYYNIIKSNISSGSSYKSLDGVTFDILDSENYGAGIFLQDLSAVSDIVLSDSQDRILLFNDSFGNEWEYDAGSEVYDVSVGDLSFEDSGNEVLVASRYSIFLLNSSGSLLWNYSMFGRSSFIGTTQSGVKFGLIGLNNGTLLECSESSCQSVKSFSSYIKDITLSDLHSDSGNEIGILLGNDDFYILSEDYSVVETITSLSSQRSITSGRFFSVDDISNTLLTGSSSLSAYNFIIPQDISFFVDSVNSWNQTGSFRGSAVDNFSSDITSYLSGCSGAICYVPIHLESSSLGSFPMNLKNLSITFSYNYSHGLSYNDSFYRWLTTKDITADSAHAYRSLKVIYEEPPQLPLYVKSIIRDNPNSTNFVYLSEPFWFNHINCSGIGSTAYLGYTASDGSSVSCDRDYYISSGYLRDPDYLWYDDTTDVPVSSSAVTGSRFSHNYYNFTIYRSTSYTSDTFRNITFSSSLAESFVYGNLTVLLDSDHDGIADYDITPASSESSCDSSSPSYDTFNISGRIYSICYEDRDLNGSVDYIKILHPLIEPSGDLSTTIPMLVIPIILLLAHLLIFLIIIISH